MLPPPLPGPFEHEYTLRHCYPHLNISASHCLILKLDRFSSFALHCQPTWQCCALRLNDSIDRHQQINECSRHIVANKFVVNGKTTRSHAREPPCTRDLAVLERYPVSAPLAGSVWHVDVLLVDVPYKGKVVWELERVKVKWWMWHARVLVCLV